MTPLLQLHDVYANIGQFQILQGVSFSVAPNQITVLLGRNGAGKTTTLRSIMNYCKAHAGQVLFEGQDIRKLKTHRMRSLGIGYMPEERLIFPNLTVKENLQMSAKGRKREQEERIQEVLNWFPELSNALTRYAGTLSGGQRQMLGMASLMMSRHKLLLIDEPSKGLSPLLVERLGQILLELKREHTILLVEQNFHLASLVGDRFVILDDGRSVQDGEMEELRRDTELQTTYLGISSRGHKEAGAS